MIINELEMINEILNVVCQRQRMACSLTYEKVPIIIQMHYEWRPRKILEEQELEMLFHERMRVGL